jgi:hypothetical protein
MGRHATKEMNSIGEITENWIKATYPHAKKADCWNYRNRMDMFFKFLGTNESDFIEGFKRAKDKLEWSKRVGLKVVAFYDKRIAEGKATNSARSESSTVRAFLRDNATSVQIKRGRIAKAKSALGEHEFTREELAKMFYVADVRGKAVLATGVSLGFSIQDFIELKRDYIESLVNKAINEKIEFLGFDMARGKTGVISRSHLTPEAVSSLKSWFEYIDKERAKKGLGKSEWVWCNGNGSYLSEQTINDILKQLVNDASISVTGKIKFHLLRKFLMSALHDSGFDSWETKRALGKEIPTSDDTYLKGLSRKVTEKFPKAYSEIRLNGFTNHNTTKIEDLETKMRNLEIQLENNKLENDTMRRVIEYSLPKEAIQKAISKLANEYGIPMKIEEESKHPDKVEMSLIKIFSGKLEEKTETLRKLETNKDENIERQNKAKLKIDELNKRLQNGETLTDEELAKYSDEAEKE